MTESVDRYEQAYQEAKNVIHQNLSFLNECDLTAVLAWLLKLEESGGCSEAKAIRNEYVRLLAHQLSRQALESPFTREPPDGPLQPLKVSLDFITSPPVEEDGMIIPCIMRSSGEGEAEALTLSRFKEWPLGAGSPPQPRSPCRRATVPGKLRPPCKASHRKCPFPESVPCPVSSKPAPIPEGYLLKTTEEDDGPFQPAPPCSEENQFQLSRLAAQVSESTELFEFMDEIAPYTCDLGEVMQSVISEELAQFKEFVRSVYRSRMADTQELLTKEQIKLKARYEEWEGSVLRKAQEALSALKLALPTFHYEAHKKDPEYLYYMLKEKMAIEETDVNPQIRILRAKAQKKTWLNEEAQRTEQDNMDRLVEMREINAQITALTNSYNCSHSKLTDRTKVLENEVAKLRIRHDEYQKQIDELIDQLNTPSKSY